MKLFKDRKEFLTVLFLFGLVLFIRVVYIPTGRVWYDEAVSILTARMSVGEIHQLSLVNNNPPTHSILLHYYVQVFGESERTLRLLSVVFGVLSSFFIFLIVKELTRDKLTPRIALFLVAVSPFHLYYSHEIRVYSLVILVSSVTLLSLLKRVNKRGPAVFWDILYTLSLTLGVYLHITYLFYVLALNVFLVVEVIRSRRRDLLVRNLIVPNAFLVVSLTPSHLLGYPIVTPQIRHTLDVKTIVGQSPALRNLAEDFLSSIIRVYWHGLLIPSLLVSTAVLLYLGFVRMVKRGHHTLLFLLVLATSLLASPRFPATSKYLAYSFPSVVVLLSLGSYQFWKIGCKLWGRKIKLNKAPIVVALSLAILLSIQTGLTSRESRYVCSRQLALFFQTNPLPESVILVMPSWERDTLLYYFKGSEEVKGVNPKFDSQGSGLSLAENVDVNWRAVVDEESVTNLRNYIRGSKNIWYVSLHRFADLENLVLGWLVENTNLKKIYYVKCSEIRDDPATRMPVLLFRNEGI